MAPCKKRCEWRDHGGAAGQEWAREGSIKRDGTEAEPPPAKNGGQLRRPSQDGVKGQVEL